MSHKDALQLLLPVELGGVFDADLEIDAKVLDGVQEDAEQLLEEMFPQFALLTLSDWERICGITPSTDEPVESRRQNILRVLRQRGGLSRAFYENLAAALGYEIEIGEPVPFECGVSRCGDHLYIDDIIWMWTVNVLNTPIYYFACGESSCGDPLSWWRSATVLEGIFEELKPYETAVVFSY